MVNYISGFISLLIWLFTYKNIAMKGVNLMYSENETVYLLMKEIAKVLREPSSLCDDLKKQLEKIANTDDQNNLTLKKDMKSTSCGTKEKKRSDYFYSTTKVKLCSFKEIPSYITLILKDSPISIINNSHLYCKLLNTYEVNTNSFNLSKNMLPKFKDSKQIPVEKTYTVCWQYRKIEDN